MNDRRDIAVVLLKIQGTLFLLAGLTALPFGIVEPAMRVEGLLTILLAGTIFVLAGRVRRERRWAMRWTALIELLSLLGSMLLAILPIGAIRGPVPLLTNLVLPAVIIFLVRSCKMSPLHPSPGGRGGGGGKHPQVGLGAETAA